MLYTVLFAEQFGERLIDALLREVIDSQAFDQIVHPAFAGNGEAKDYVARNAVIAVAGDTHRDPTTVSAQCPIVHVVDRRVGR